jgi:hypothetical protein
MKRFEVAALFFFFILSGVLSGCTSPPPGEDTTHDSLLIGQWRNPRTLEILVFSADGTYTITEGEYANWSTEPGGVLWMFGTQYTYSFSENNTVLSISEPGYTRTFQKI